MTLQVLVILAAVCFVTCGVGVVTGSNSLIAVPVMFQLGIDPKTAVATNMFGLTFMSIGASIPFVRQRKIDASRVTPLIFITLVSSLLGALLVGILSSDTLKLVVSASMIFVAAFILLRRNAGVEDMSRGRSAMPLTYLLTFALGIYGGLFSGGYVTILTAVLVGISGMRYGEAVASTKLINVFSSAIATIVFMWQGLVDYRLGAVIAVAMFTGAYVGAHFAAKMNDVWLRRIFLVTVFVLAAKTIYDLISS